MTAQSQLYCFGFGYSAGRLLRRLGPDRHAGGTSRSGGTRGGLRLDAYSRDSPLPDPRARLARVTHILVSIPPDDAGDPVADLHGDDLAALPNLRWLGYLSTTGVYGDTGGAWVDEDAPVSPGSERAARRAAAEQTWLGLWRDRGLPVHVFRLPGIYGPGRSAIDQLRAGTARRIDKPGQVFSRIHVDDIAATLQASMAAPDPGQIYNVADDEPAPQAEVVAHAAALLGIEPPPLIPVDDDSLSEMARSFYAECRRVSNARIKQALGVTLQYPSYREGLASILAGESADLADGAA
ncbi:MAG: SDR family oxidoreductase [Bauldia litoralis]